MDENDVKMTETMHEPTGLYHNEAGALQTVRTDSETRASLQTASQDAESRIVFYQTDASNIVERAAKLNRSNHFEGRAKTLADYMETVSQMLSKVGAGDKYNNSLILIQQDFRQELSTLMQELSDTGSSDPVYGDYLEAISLAGEMISAAERYVEDGKKFLEGEHTRFAGNLSELKENFQAFADFYSEEDYEDLDFEINLGGVEYTADLKEKKEKIKLAESVVSAPAYRKGDLVGTVRQLKREMQELDEKIPEGMKEFFSGVTTWPEFEEREKEYRNIDDERSFADSLRERISKYLGSLGYDFKFGNVSTAMSSYMDPNNNDHYMIAWNLLHSEYAADIPDEVIGHVNDFLEANVEQYKVSLNNVRLQSAERKALPLMWQRMALEYRIAIMLAEDPTEEKEADAIGIVLDSFGKELEAGEADEQPSAEYEAFVKALKNAGEEGGMEALAESAQEYISKEEEKHSEEKEHYRLDVAKQVLTVTRTARAIEQHHAERMELFAPETASKPVQEERPSVKAAEERKTISIADTLSAADIKEEAARLRVELEEKAREKAKIEAARREEAEREAARREAERLKKEQEKKAQEEAAKAAEEVRTAEDAARLAEQNRHRYDYLLKDEQGNPIPTVKHPDGQVRPYYPIDRVTEHGRRFLEGEILGLVARENPDASYEECVEIAGKMMGIFDNNLTGNKSRDRANLYAEYREAFMIAPEGGKAPLEAAAVNGGILLSLERIIQEVEYYDETLQHFGMGKDDPDPLKTIEDIQLSEIRAKAEAYRKYTAEIEAAGPVLEELLNIELTGNDRFDKVNMARVVSRAFPSASIFQPPALTRHFSIADYANNATNPLFNLMYSYSARINAAKYKKNVSMADLQEEYRGALRDALDQAKFPLNSDFTAKLAEISKKDELTPEERSFLLENNLDDLAAFQDLYMELEDFSDAFEASVMMHEESARKATEFNKEKVKVYIKENQQMLAKAAAAKAAAEKAEAEKAAAEKTEVKPETEQPETEKVEEQPETEKVEEQPETEKVDEQPETEKVEEQSASLYERVLNLSFDNHIPDRGLKALIMGMALDADALSKEDPGADISAHLTNINKNYPAVMAFVSKKLASTDPSDPAYKEYREFLALGSEITEIAKLRSEGLSQNAPEETVNPSGDDLEDDEVEYQTGSANAGDDFAENSPENGGLEEMLSAIRAENGELPYIATGNTIIDNEYAFIADHMLITSLMRESDGTAEEIINGVAKMKEILNYNLTGDYEKDSENITREYEQAFYEAPEGKKPLMQRPDGKSGNIPTINYLLGFVRKYDEYAADIAQGPELRAKLEQDLPGKLQKKYDGLQKASGDLVSVLGTIRKELADITLTGIKDQDADKLDTWFNRNYPERVDETKMYNSIDSLCAYYAGQWKLAADNYLFEYERKMLKIVDEPGAEDAVAALQEEYRKGLTSALQDAEFTFTPDFCENMAALSHAEDLTLEQKNHLLSASPLNLIELQTVFKENGDIRASFEKYMQQRAEKEAAAREEQNKKVADFVADAKNNPEIERTPEELAQIYSDAAKYSGEWDWDVSNGRFIFDFSPETMAKNIMPDGSEDQDTADGPEEKTEEKVEEKTAEAEKAQQYDAFGNPILTGKEADSRVRDISEALGTLASDPDEYNPFAAGWTAEGQRTADNAEKTPAELQRNDADGNPAPSEENPVLTALREAVRNQAAEQDDPFGIKAEAARRGISVEEAGRIMLEQNQAYQWREAVKQMAEADAQVNRNVTPKPKAEDAETKQEDGPSWSFEQFEDVQPEWPNNEEPKTGEPDDWNAVMAEVAKHNGTAEAKQEEAPTWNFDLFNNDKAEEPPVEDAKPEGSKIEQPQEEQPQEEAVEAEEQKPEEVKAEEPKPEEVKAEEVKAEEPKPEEAKVEEPKPVEVKAEEPSLASLVRDQAKQNRAIISWLNMAQNTTFRSSNPDVAAALEKIARFNKEEDEFGSLADELETTRGAAERKKLEDSIKIKVTGMIPLSIEDAWNQVSYSLDKIDYTDRSFETLNSLASYLADCRYNYGRLEPDKQQDRAKARGSRFEELYKKLDSYKKSFTSDTEEFTEFKNSLLDAANGGDVKKLYEAAKKYESEKTKNGTSPNTQNGKNRLTIAKRVLAHISPEELREPEAAKEIKVDNKPDVAAEIKPDVKPEKPVEPEKMPEPEKVVESEKPVNEIKLALQSAKNTIMNPDASLPEVRDAIAVLVADKVLERAVSFNPQIRDAIQADYADTLKKKGHVAEMGKDEIVKLWNNLRTSNSDFVFGIYIGDEARKITAGGVTYGKVRDDGNKAEDYLRSMPDDLAPDMLAEARKSCVDMLLYKHIRSLGSMDNDTKTYSNLAMRDDVFFSGEVDRTRKVISELDIVKNAMDDPKAMKQLLRMPERELAQKIMYPSRLKAIEDKSWAVLENISSSPEEITGAVSELLLVTQIKMKGIEETEKFFGKSLAESKSNPSIVQSGMAFEKFLKTQAGELQKNREFRQFCSNPLTLRNNLLGQKDPNVLKNKEYADPDLRAGRWLLSKFNNEKNLSNDNNSLIKDSQAIIVEAYSRKAFASKLNQLGLKMDERFQALVYLADLKGCTMNGKSITDQIMQNAEVALVKDGQERDNALKEFRNLVSSACDASIGHLTNNAAQYDRLFSAIANSAGSETIPNVEVAGAALNCYKGYFAGNHKAKVGENCAKHIGSILENSDRANARIQAQLAKQASAKKQNAGPAK